MDVERILQTVEPLLPQFRKNRLFVTSRPGVEDPLHDGSGWLPDGVTEADFTVLNAPFRDTAIEELLQSIPYKLGRVRLMILPPKTCYSFHFDTTTRLHYAITTNPDCYLVERQQEQAKLFHVPADGWVYRMDTRLVHNAMNCSNEPRLHLVAANLEEEGPPGAKPTDLASHPIPELDKT